MVKHPGSCHDAAVFKESMLYKNADIIIPQVNLYSIEIFILMFIFI